MKTILVIADKTPEAEHAAVFALMIAQAVHADVLIASTVKSKQTNSNETVLAGENSAPIEEQHDDLPARLNNLIDQQREYIPEIAELDISDYKIADLVAMINREQIWLLAEGMADSLSRDAENLKLNIQSVLNRVCCPLLLIPQCWQIKVPERIVYLADLRYCRQFVLKFLTTLAAPFNAGISIAHLSAKGLADIVEPYATTLFQNEIMPYAHYDKLTMNNIRERDLHKALDVMINGMHNDVMVLVHRRYHFEELIGWYLGEVLPPDITIPVLIFPL